MSPIAKEQDLLTAAPQNAPTSSSSAADATKAQPVALEISVTVNGARTIEGSDKREPFSESTKTVLVLGTGAVIRLSSSVAPGQLLFLTNDKTKKEVVCQVVKSKNFRNVSGYVELEFTEPAVGFWGMRFPTDRIGAPATTPAPVAVGAPLISVPPSPLPASQSAEARPVAPPASAPVAAKPLENITPAPVAAAPPLASHTKIPALSSAPVSPLTSTNSSYSSTSLSSSSPNASVLSLPRALEAKPAVPVPSANTPSVLPATPSAEETPVPQRRASDQRKAALPSAETKPVADLFKPQSAHPEAAAKVISIDKHEAPIAKSSANSTVSFAATPSLDLQAEETKIPAWLEPLARNAVAPSSTQELIEREKAKHTAAMAEILQPAAISEPVTEEIPEVHAEVAAPTFGGSYATDERVISEGVSPSSSKKGLFIGVVAAGLALAAGGWWYLQQGPRTPQTPPSAVATPSATNANSVSAAPNNFLPNANVPSNTVAAGQPVSSSTVTSTKPNTAQPLASVVPQTASPDFSAAEKSSRVVPAAVVPQQKKPSLGDVRLATPNVNSQGGGNLSAEAAPSLTNEEEGGASLGAGVGLAGNNHRQPAAPAPALPVGGDVKAAKLLSSVSPVYPALAKTQHVSGDVKVDALVEANGRVTTMKIVSGPTLLQQAAMDAIRGWKYQPATLDGKPVSMHLTVTLQFRLQQ